MAKTKITGFARMLIFLIIFLPLSFFGASYINGEDPWQKIREFTAGEKQEQRDAKPQNNVPKSSTKGAEEQLQKRVKELERKLAVAEEKLARCKLEQAQNQ